MKASRCLGAICAAVFAFFVVGAGSASATTLCGAEPELLEEKLLCPAGEEVGADIVAGEVMEGNLPEKATAKLESSSGTITCNEASFVGEFNSNGTSPKGGGIKQWKFGNSKSTKCPSTLPLKPNVEIKMEGLPYDTSKVDYKSTKAPQGSLTIAGAKGVTMKLALGAECTYESVGTMTSSYINPKEKGKLAELEMAGSELKKVGEGKAALAGSVFCGSGGHASSVGRMFFRPIS